MLSITLHNGVQQNYDKYTAQRVEGMVLVIEGVPKSEVEVWSGKEYSVNTGQRITVPLHLITRIVERICTPIARSNSRTRTRTASPK